MLVIFFLFVAACWFQSSMLSIVIRKTKWPQFFSACINSAKYQSSMLVFSSCFKQHAGSKAACCPFQFEIQSGFSCFILIYVLCISQNQHAGLSPLFSSSMLVYPVCLNSFLFLDLNHSFLAQSSQPVSLFHFLAITTLRVNISN